MFAVLKTGGKQYRVQSGDVLRVERLAASAGEKIQFNDVLMVGSTVGTPFVDDAAVQAEVIDQIKGDKVIHFVKRRRKHSSQRTKGHRQHLTLLRVTDILEKGADKSGVKVAIGAAAAIAAGIVVAPAVATAKKPAAKKDAAPKAAKPKAEVQKATPKTEEPKAAPKADAGSDDLKKLSGVGPALEKKLHAAGVTTFAQIAAWGSDEITEFDEKLSFKGRIEREGWVEQAKAIAAEKE